jgi:hypothetical protein
VSVFEQRIFALHEVKQRGMRGFINDAALCAHELTTPSQMSSIETFSFTQLARALSYRSEQESSPGDREKKKALYTNKLPQLFSAFVSSRKQISSNKNSERAHKAQLGARNEHNKIKKWFSSPFFRWENWRTQHVTTTDAMASRDNALSEQQRLTLTLHAVINDRAHLDIGALPVLIIAHHLRVRDFISLPGQAASMDE